MRFEIEFKKENSDFINVVATSDDIISAISIYSRILNDNINYNYNELSKGCDTYTLLVINESDDKCDILASIRLKDFKNMEYVDRCIFLNNIDKVGY